VNAAEQAITVERASKIAAVVNRFKSEFPDVRVDLKPWMNDPDTRKLVDPDSIDVGFHFPGRSRRFQSRSILVQIRFSGNEQADARRAIGLELAGFDHQGKQWHFSTINQWAFEGDCVPIAEVQDQLRAFCRESLQVFNGQ
jgi:hypothetical protein